MIRGSIPGGGLITVGTALTASPGEPDGITRGGIRIIHGTDRDGDIPGGTRDGTTLGGDGTDGTAGTIRGGIRGGTITDGARVRVRLITMERISITADALPLPEDLLIPLQTGRTPQEALTGEILT